MNIEDAENKIYNYDEIKKPVKFLTISETDKMNRMTFKPFDYDVKSNFSKGLSIGIGEMADIPNEIILFGKRANLAIGGYFGDTPEEFENKRLNLITAERNLLEAKRNRMLENKVSRETSESLAFNIGSNIPTFASMLVGAGAAYKAVKAVGTAEKALSAAGKVGLFENFLFEGAGEVAKKTPVISKTDERIKKGEAKAGELDVEKITKQWAAKSSLDVPLYATVSTILEAKVGFGEQLTIWNTPIKLSGTTKNIIARAFAKTGITAASESTTETLQSLASTGINLIDGTITPKELPEELQEAVMSGVVGGIMGTASGGSVSLRQARNAISMIRSQIEPVVGKEKAQDIAEEIFNDANTSLSNVVTRELELDSQLKNKHGNVWNSMLAAVSKEIEGKPRFKGWTEDEKAHYANTVAKHFADNLLAEANFRGTTIDAILTASDIKYDKGIKIARHINLFDALKNPQMIPPETKLKRETLLAFLKRMGGLKDVGGELKSRDARKGYPGLINNKNGMNLDDAALLAWQHGYFPTKIERPDINELIDAIDAGLRGKHRYNIEDEITFSDQLLDLETELDRVGIDWENMTAAEIEQAVNDLPELDSLQREAEFYANYEPDIGLSEEEAERLAIMTEDKKYPIISEKDLPERYYQEGEDRDLVALHSISASNLEKAIDFGGFPVPSIAIVKKGQEFHFDDLPITLVGNKEMIDPYEERNEVYNRDVWSKTFPFKTYKNPTEAKVKKFEDKYEGYFKKSASENQLGSFIYQVQRLNPASAFNEYKNSSGMILYYLENIKGEKVELKKKDVASDALSRAGIDEELANKIKGLDVEADREKIGKAYLAMKEKEIAEDFADIQDEEKKNKFIKLSRKMLLENKFDKDGKLYFSVADTIVTAAKRYFEAKGKKVLDHYEVSRFLREKVKDDAKYEEWAEKTFEDDLVGNPMVEVGNKLKPFTIGNVVDAMILGNTVASQNAFFGSGKIIASGAKKLETIRDIKEEGEKLVSKEQSQKNMEEVNEQIDTFTRYFMDKNDFQQNMDRKTASGEALAQVVKNKNITKESLQKALNKYLVGKEKYSDEALSYGIQVAKNIKNLARYYFEAKPQRAVGLNEFSGAIMPTSTEFDAIAKKAEDAGLKVVRSDNQTEALEQFDNVFFQRGKNAKGYTNITPDEYIIKLLEEADESTLPHEFAHYWLTEMWNYTRTGRASESYMKRWQIISDYLGIRPEQTRLTRAQQEKFASSYEAYLTRGQLPTPLIGSAFDDYDKWLQRVYNDYNRINYQGKRRVRLTDAAIKFFQSMTTGTLEAPALAPKDTGVTIPEKVETVPVETIEAPTTYDTTRVINITEGEKGVSKVFQREAMKHADRIVDELGVSYNKINLEEQAIKATEWVQNNLEEARKVVNGAAAPEGIIDTAIFIAYENEMLRIGNNAEYQRALKIHSQVQTQRGQAIAAERISTDDVYNPAYWWKKLQHHKETQVAQQLFKGDVKALQETIDTETKKIMKEIAGKSKEEQVEKLTKLAEKIKKDYNLDTFYQMPDEINERTVKEFIKDTLGVNPDIMAGNEVINKAEQLQKLWENTKDKSGNPSVEAMRAKRELNDLIQAQTPSNALAIWTSIFGRGIMLTSIKSPVLNIISNIEAGFTEGITRRLMYGTTQKAVDKSVKDEFSKYAWEVYKASSDIVTTMTDYDDDMRIIGEQILHSQGKGRFRAASRVIEEVSFKYLMGAPDAVAKTLAFNDTADLLATKIAKEEGAKDISKRATEIYKDAILIKPETEEGKQVREQSQIQAHYTTFTNDSWASKFGLSARNWLNMVGRNKIRLGDLTMKFVKTPANVQMMGLEYGFGLLYTTYHVQDIINNPQSETSKIAIRAAVRNGLGIALAALLYAMLDPEDYFSEFDTLNPKEKDRMRALGAMPNSIKIGNKWVSLDYFGQLGIPLVGMLEARRNNGLRSYIQSGLTQAAKIPGIKETKQLIDSMSEYARYDLKPEKIAQMMASTVLDQTRAMTIPAIVNDIAKMTDDYERDTMGGVMDKVISSIPGLRQTLPEKYGIQGLVRTEPGISTLLFGSRVKTVQSTQLVREVEKLGSKGEQPSISDVTKYGDLRLLSPEKKVRVRKEFYKLYGSESKKLIATREYQKKSPEDKKKALNKVRNRVVKSLKEKYSNDIKREKRRL